MSLPPPSPGRGRGRAVGLAVGLALVPVLGQGRGLVPAPGLAAAQPARDWGGADRPYLKQLHDQIHPRWSAFLTELGRLEARYQDVGLAAEVLLVIDGRGALRRVDYAQHAALKGFDDAPADLLRDLGPLPAPPKELQSDDGNVYVRWRFSRRAPGCEQHAVIERRLLLGEAVPLLVDTGRAQEAARRVREEAPPAERPVLLRRFVEQLGRAAARSKDPSERELGAAILAQLPDGESALLSLLEDRTPSVRVRALEALSGQLLSPAVAPALRKLLDSEDRAIAALLLARLRDRGAVPTLREALQAGQRPAETAAALRSLDDGAEASRIVAHMLEQPDRAQAGATAARALGDPAHAPLLLKLATGPEAIRLAVLDALGAMGSRAPAEARRAVLRAMSDMSPKVRAQAMRACAGFGDRSTGLRYRLIDALPDPDPRVRAAAGTALVEVGGEEAKDELLRVLKDRSVAVRAAVLQAAMAHPYASASTLIGRLRKDPEVEEAARQPAPREEDLLPDEAQAAEAGPRRRAPLLTSRIVTLPAGTGEEDRLTERLLGAATSQERLRAAAGWLALQRPQGTSGAAPGDAGGP